MALPLIAGIGLMAGGQGLQHLGQRDRYQAQKRAGRDYEDRFNQFSMAEGQATSDYYRQMQQSQRDRLDGVGGTLGGITGAYSQDRQDPELMARVQALQQQAAGANPTGAPVGGMAQMAPDVGHRATGKADQSRDALMSMMLEDDYHKRVGATQHEATIDQQIQDLVRMASLAGAREQLEIGRALRQLQWQRDALGLQRNIDHASRVGGGLMLGGGIMGQGGSLMFQNAMNQRGRQAGSPQPAPGGQA